MPLHPWFAAILSRLQPLEPDEIPRNENRLPGEGSTTADREADKDLGIRTVGAWTGRASLANPTRDVDFCVANRLNRLDVIVNDHSAERSPRRFDTHRPDRVLRLCELARAAGLEVHFMSWIMPHEDYLRGAAEQLIPLAKEAGVTSIQWDAEEPWMRAKRAMPYEAASELVRELFGDCGIEQGANAIGYTSVGKFGPLAKVVDYIVPQAYATARSGLDPATVAAKFYRRYEAKFGPKRIVMGLAAYRQEGIPGHTVASAMQAAVAGAKTLEGVDTVIYWSLGHIRRDPRVARVVRSIRDGGIA